MPPIHFRNLIIGVISFFIFYVFFLHKVIGMIFKRALAVEEILLNWSISSEVTVSWCGNIHSDFYGCFLCYLFCSSWKWRCSINYLVYLFYLLISNGKLLVSSLHFRGDFDINFKRGEADKNLCYRKYLILMRNLKVKWKAE